LIHLETKISQIKLLGLLTTSVKGPEQHTFNTRQLSNVFMVKILLMNNSFSILLINYEVF